MENIIMLKELGTVRVYNTYMLLLGVGFYILTLLYGFKNIDTIVGGLGIILYACITGSICSLILLKAEKDIIILEPKLFIDTCKEYEINIGLALEYLNEGKYRNYEELKKEVKQLEKEEKVDIKYGME